MSENNRDMRVSLGFGGFAPLAPTVPVVRAAEAAGLDGVWSAEHLGFHDAVVPSALYATVTERPEIGLIGHSPISRHPGLLAMELAGLAELAPGRVRVQVGTGDPALVGRLGDTSGPLVSRIEQFVTVLRALLAGEEVSGEYAGHRFDGYTIAPLEGDYGIPPVDPPIPIDVMAIRPRMLALAARVADGASLSTGASLGYLAGVVRAVEGTLSELERDRSSFRIVAHTLAAVAPTEEEALAALEPMLMLSAAGALKLLAADLFDPDELDAAGGDPEREAELITPTVARRLGFVATPDTAGAAIAEYAATGIDELCLHFETPPEQTAARLAAVAAGRRSPTRQEIS